jgi:hypothetical protein
MKKKSIRFQLAAIAAILLLSFYAGSAQAALKAMGPINPVSTLPDWYQDLDNVALQICLDQNGFCVLTPQFDPLITNPPDPITTTGPINDLNFPNENFYFLADAIMNVNGDIAKLRIALEGAFLTGVAPNTGITFLRIVLKSMNGLPPNQTYTVTHPFGSFQFSTDALGSTPKANGQAFRVEDPIAPTNLIYFPPDMQAAANTNIGPFLKATGGNIVDPVSGNTYLGNPAIPVTVTGSPTGNNFFRITGPDIGGPGVNTVQTTLFALSGKVFTGPIATPLKVDRATYAQNATTTDIDVFAISGPVSNLGTPSVLQVTGAGIPTTTMTMSAAGEAYTRISIPNPATMPAIVTVANISDNAAVPTEAVAPLVDEVNIFQANFNPVDNSLTIQAASRDQLNPPALAAGLSATDNTLGALNAAGTRVVANLTTPPPAVTVNSANRGSATVPISVALPPPPAGGLTLAASPAGPVAGGGIVAFTATAAGTGPFEYQFLGRRAGPVPLVIAQPYGASSIFNWNTAGILGGTYEIQAQVRHVGAAVPFEASQSMTYTVTTPSATGVTITASPASPQLPGTQVTFTAAAAGGGVYEYQFIGRQVGNPTFAAAQAYSEINSWTWNTTGVAPGQYEVIVLARAAGSSAAFEATQTILYSISASTVAVTLGASPASPVAAGTAITFTGTATPAGGNYEYQFLGRRVGDPAFAVAQAYGPSNTWNWSGATGSWEIQVQVRNVGSANPFDALQTITYTVN